MKIRKLSLCISMVGLLAALPAAYAADAITNCAQVAATGDENPVNDKSCVDINVVPTPVSVGDYIWEDTDQDGKQTAGEQALVGATVTLLDKDGNPAKDLTGTAVAAVTTDSTGKYLFSNLPEGEYQVVVTPPAGYVATTAVADIDNTPSNTDSNCAVADGKTSKFTLTAGGEPVDDGDTTPDANSNLSVDCGFYKPTHSIGNRVWIDTNNSGEADVGELPVQAGITLTLKDKDGKTLDALTDAEGRYLFSGLVAGEYQVCVAESNFATGGKLAGYTPSTGAKAVVDANTDIDGDANGSNIAGAGLCADKVVLGVDEPTQELTAGAKGDDGQGTPDTYSNLTVDFGVVPPPPPKVSVGNFVWEDTNKDGLQSAGEPALKDVLVTLTDKNGLAVKDLDGKDVLPQTTLTDGKYLFSNLPEGDYIVQFAKLPGYDFTTTGTNPDALDDSNCVATDGKTAAFTLTAGGELDTDGDGKDSDLTQDCGMVKQAVAPTPVSVGNFVWEDTNKDGLQSAGEPALKDVLVTLTDKNGLAVKDLDGKDVLPQTTLTDGKYLFSNLPEGDYIVQFAKLPGYDFTTTGTNPDALDDSNCVATDGKTAAFTLTAGGELDTDGDGKDSDLTQDCGMVKQTTTPVTVSVGDTIWEDTNRDGKQSAGEPTLKGITVTLYDKNNVLVKTATTDVNGKYLFKDLPEGEYYIVVTKPTDYIFTTLGTDLAANDDSNCAVDGKTTLFTLTAGGESITDGDIDPNTDLTQDCGLQKPVITNSIGNRVWKDTNGNGLADIGETDAGAGIKLVLKDATGKELDNTITDAAGRYLFTNLAEGSYQVCVAASNFATGNLLAGYTASQGVNEQLNANLGADGKDDSGIDGDDNGTNDTSTGLCSGLVVLNDKEPLLETTATGDNGNDGTSTPDNRSNLTVDFGVVPPPPKTVNVGDYIWIDENKNGQQDAGEKPLPGAEVTLLNKDGSPVIIEGDIALGPKTTGEDGKYFFSGLPEGDYIIKVKAVGYTLTKAGAGVDVDASNTDSNCQADLGGTLPFNLTAGAEPEGDGDGVNGNLSVDCGFYPNDVPAVSHSLGNKVWIDDGAGITANANNGIMDAGEKPVANGVRMELWSATDPVTNLGSTTTTNGFYAFGGLAAGDYRVCIASSNFDAGGLLAGYTASIGGNELDPNDDGDKNDNGDDDLQYGICNTKVITLGADEPTNEADTASGTVGDDGLGTDNAHSNLTLDFGVLPPPVVPGKVSIGDTVWIDLNADGKQGGGEPGMAGATVTLLDASGKVVGTPFITKADGKYVFKDLDEGKYKVSVVPAPGYLPTITVSDANNDVDDDSNGVAGNGSYTSSLVELKAGEEPEGAHNPTVDFGFVPNMKVPTLSQWGVAFLSMLLATAAFFRRRRED
jgi:hypothetical protein